MYDLGDPVPLSVTVRDSAGTPANAGAITLTVTRPDGTTETPTVTNVSPGVYEATVTPLEEGRYTVRWVATGANASAYTDVFDVRPGQSIALFSLADARKALNITNTNHDEELREYVDATTFVVEQRVGAVVPRTVVETVRARGHAIQLSITPVVSIVSLGSVLVGAWEYDAADLRFDGNTGTVWLYSRGSWSGDPYTVTYRAGREGLVPANISVAARIILKHLWRTQQPSSGRPGGAGDPMAAVTGGGFAIPNAAEQLLSPHLNMDGIA